MFLGQRPTELSCGYCFKQCMGFHRVILPHCAENRVEMCVAVGWIQFYEPSLTISDPQIPFMRKVLDSKAGQDIARPNTRANSISLAHKMEFGICFQIIIGYRTTNSRYLADTVTAEFTPSVVRRLCR